MGSYFLAEASRYRSNTNKIGDNAVLTGVNDISPLSAAGAELCLSKEKLNILLSGCGAMGTTLPGQKQEIKDKGRR